MEENKNTETIKEICNAFKKNPYAIHYLIKSLDILCEDEINYGIIRTFSSVIKADEELLSIIINYYDKTLNHSDSSVFFERFISDYISNEKTDAQALTESNEHLVQKVYEDYLRKRVDDMYKDIYNKNEYPKK